jgi:hypothetical protein
MFALLKMVDPDISVKLPIEVLGFGSVMLVIIVLIHGAGLNRILGLYERRAEVYRLRLRHPYLATFIFAATILLMLFLHVFEILVWGVALHRTGLVSNFRDAMYFSANTYTTIGYGLMILPYNWRELSPLMAISGLFTFAWTTGELFGIVDRQRRLVKDLAAQRKTGKPAMNIVPAQVTRQAQATNGHQEQPEVLLTRDQRRALREEIETKLKQLHDAERSEVEGLRRDES